MFPWPIVILCAAACQWIGCTAQPAREGDASGDAYSEHVPYPDGTPAAACAPCHQEIWDEWRQSAHAQAFVQEEFRRATRDRQEDDCLRCHIPKSMDTLATGPVRTRFREEGVTCESCHLSGDGYTAPRRPTTFALHKVVVKGFMREAAFCGRCHEKIFKQWSAIAMAPKEKQTCQQCHMSAVHRKTIAGTRWRILHRKFDGRRHEFAVLPSAAGKPSVEVEVSLGEVSATRVAGRVTVSNTGAYHSIPGGAFGFREIAVISALVDRYGVASVKQVHRLLNRKGRDLAYGQSKALPFRFEPVPQDAEALEVRVVRVSGKGLEGVLRTETFPLRALASRKPEADAQTAAPD